MKGSEWWETEVPPGVLGEGYIRAILKAIQNGWLHSVWWPITLGDLTFNISNPLAVGAPEDHVYLFGLSAEDVDRIALALGDVMSPTPMLWDAAAEDPAQVQVGPFIQPNGRGGMTKQAAKAHSDNITQRQGGVEPCSLISACCKTYVLDRYRPHPGPAIRPHYACEYGWRLPHPGQPNDSKTGWVVQPSHWAHFYLHFRDYSMGAVFVQKAAQLHGKTVDLGKLALDPRLASLVSLSGPVPFLIHPECRDVSEAESEPNDNTPHQPTIRLGDRGPAVGQWQAVLVAAGYSLEPFGADDHFGRLTHQRTIQFQRERGLVPDGVVGAKTWGAVGEPASSLPEPPATKLAPLVSTSQRQALFGAFSYEPAPTPQNPEAIRITDGWVGENIRRVVVPQLQGVPGAPHTGGVFFHKAVSDQLVRLFQAWEDAGLLHLVESWAGSWVPRFIRGSRSTLSNHAFGTAFDINAPWNPLGATPAGRGEKGTVIPLVKLANEHGFFWGGHFRSRPDGMHFEAVQIL